MTTAALFHYLHKLLVLYYLLILLNVAFVWFRISPYHPRLGGLVRGVRAATDPLLNPIRAALAPYTLRLGGLDWSPVLLWLLLEAIYSLLYHLLVS